MNALLKVKRLVDDIDHDCAGRSLIYIVIKWNCLGLHPSKLWKWW